MHSLRADIEAHDARPNHELDQVTRRVLIDFLMALDEGEVRAAERSGDEWIVHGWVKRGILLAFRMGVVTELSINDRFQFFDKDTLPPQDLRGRNVRVVPGGTAVREGCHLASGVVIMPPSYVNVGAYVGEGTMIDSHALVGSCAQVGARVHLSAGAQLGGVLEPIGARPVIIEDDVFVGALSGVFEGVRVRRGAVIGSGVCLTASTPLYDLVRDETLRSEPDRPLEVPEGAVVVAGSRPAPGPMGERMGLQIYAPMIVKYRDEKTSARTALEDALR